MEFMPNSNNRESMIKYNENLRVNGRIKSNFYDQWRWFKFELNRLRKLGQNLYSPKMLFKLTLSNESPFRSNLAWSFFRTLLHPLPFGYLFSWNSSFFTLKFFFSPIFIFFVMSTQRSSLFDKKSTSWFKLREILNYATLLKTWFQEVKLRSLSNFLFKTKFDSHKLILLKKNMIYLIR